jgi:uncharacterized membrane protein YqjE
MDEASHVLNEMLLFALLILIFATYMSIYLTILMVWIIRVARSLASVSCYNLILFLCFQVSK